MLSSCSTVRPCGGSTIHPTATNFADRRDIGYGQGTEAKEPRTQEAGARRFAVSAPDQTGAGEAWWQMIAATADARFMRVDTRDRPGHGLRSIGAREAMAAAYLHQGHSSGHSISPLTGTCSIAMWARTEIIRSIDGGNRSW